MSSKQLPAPLRTRMERAFGADFSAVTVHEDGAAGALGAEAYARGDALHFAPGRYDPDTPAGEELIAHELAHVVQQRRGRVAAGEGDGDVNGDLSLEREADQLAATAVAGGAAHVAHGTGSGGAGTAIQARFANATSYDTTAWMTVLTTAGTRTRLKRRTPFECLGAVDDIGDGTPGYEIRSAGTLYYVAQAVADAGVVYAPRVLPTAHARGADTSIEDWDVGEQGLGGIARGCGEAGTTLRTSIKWGETVTGPCGTPEGTWMEATCLGPDHPQGTTNELRPGRISASTGTMWVGGHLLNDHLGGPGEDPRNIVAIPEWNTNVLHESKVESEVKKHVNERGGWVYYKVWADHETRSVRKTTLRRGAAGRDPSKKKAWAAAPEDGRGEFETEDVNIATAFNTVWCALDAQGQPTGTVFQDRFPVPKPLEPAGDETVWHEAMPQTDAPGHPGGPYTSPTYNHAPITRPATGRTHRNEYPSGQQDLAEPTTPWRDLTRLLPVLDREFLRRPTGDAPARLLLDTQSVADMFTAKNFTVRRSPGGGADVIPPPRQGRKPAPKVRASLIDHVRSRPDGESAGLVRGIMLDDHLTEKQHLLEDPEWEAQLAALAAMPELQAWEDRKPDGRKRRREDEAEQERKVEQAGEDAGEVEDAVSEAEEDEHEGEAEEDEQEGEGEGDEQEDEAPPPATRPAKRARYRSGRGGSEEEASTSD